MKKEQHKDGFTSATVTFRLTTAKEMVEIHEKALAKTPKWRFLKRRMHRRIADVYRRFL